MSTEPKLAGCEAVGPALVHYSARGIARRIIFKCWTCDKRTPFVMKWDGAWHGTTDYCTVCLDGWQDGFRMERPFRRGWKKERAAYIRKLWDEAMLPQRYHAWVHWDAHRATCWADEGECVECETRPA